MNVTYSIADFESDFQMTAYGQSFKPNMLGPDGGGVPGTSTVKVSSIAVGFHNYGIGGRSSVCYIYDHALDNPDKIGLAPGMVAISSDYDDKRNTLGPKSYARIYFIDTIDCNPLQVNSTYFIYFSKLQTVCAAFYPYEGGSAIDSDMDQDPESALQFKIELYYDS